MKGKQKDIQIYDIKFKIFPEFLLLFLNEPFFVFYNLMKCHCALLRPCQIDFSSSYYLEVLSSVSHSLSDFHCVVVVRKLQEFELPYVSVTSLCNPDYHIVLRKRYNITPLLYSTLLHFSLYKIRTFCHIQLQRLS